ncbi:energy transducer TonB [Sphingomonas sp. MA1305]|uniref:energy transducer TonB n=1 Tax=Sphingomonas sp. MA1305 TaxID=2479204 RepID=UPI0018DF7BC9|nr:energy transducer TonB [Sphingomonas sp. MA1305]
MRSVTRRPARYSDRPAGWRARGVGLAGTAMLAGCGAMAALLDWHGTPPAPPPAPAPLVIGLVAPASPPEVTPRAHKAPAPVDHHRTAAAPPPDSPPPPSPTLPAIAAAAASASPVAAEAEPLPPSPDAAPDTIAAPPAPQLAGHGPDTWEAQIMARLQRVRRYPEAARRAGQQGEVVLRFRLTRDGHVHAAAIVRGSGCAALDRAAEETLARADPLPPIPPDRPDAITLTVAIQFAVRSR